MLRHSAHAWVCSRPPAGGYTIFQIIVVLLIIGVLTVAFGYGSIGQVNSAKASIAKSVLASDVPKAFYTYMRTNGVPDDGTDMHDALVDNGVSSTTPWGDLWSAQMVGQNANYGNNSGAGLIVTYPIGGAHSEADAQSIANTLNNGYEQIALAAAQDGAVLVEYLVSSN